MLNDDEIVTSVQAESDPVDDETDKDENKINGSSKGPSNTDKFSALETAMESAIGHCRATQKRPPGHMRPADSVSLFYTDGPRWSKLTIRRS
ncbi:hypothetical protein TNCV_1532021 [Trichonephila clavipes]|nr:hypothetical protein TNCV_1532021 [Trichonephila clavipes]